MSYVLFDEAGKFQAGRVMSESDASLQVELDSGRRVKVKAANVLLRFAQPAPSELLARAQAAAAEIDLDLAWESPPPAAFGFPDLARAYFSASAGAEQQAAALLAGKRQVKNAHIGLAHNMGGSGASCVINILEAK